MSVRDSKHSILAKSARFADGKTKGFFMGKVFVTRRIPSVGIERLREYHTVDVWPGEDPPTREVLLDRVQGCSGILSILSDPIDTQIMDAAGKELRGIRPTSPSD